MDERIASDSTARFGYRQMNLQSRPQAFRFDRYGNRTAFSQNIAGNTEATNPTIDAATNRFTSGQGFGYDKNGNVIADIDPLSSLTRQFVYNGENRQTEVKRDGVTIARYFYDGEGKRVKKITNTETTVFVYSAGKLIAEYSMQISRTPQTKYLTQDHLGTPRIITNELGAVVSRRDFMPFGEELHSGVGVRSAALQYGTNEDTIRQKFTGYERDDEVGLDFAQARYYKPMYGRFTSVDPLLESASPNNPQTWNRYIYVGNNPLTVTDPTELKWSYNSAEDRYKWFGDKDKVEDGFVAVVGTRGNDDRGVGSFVYQTENGWVRLNPYTNSFSTFDTREAATGDFESVYQCNCQGLANTIADESVRKGTTAGIAAVVAVTVGTGAGVTMAATGTVIGGTVTTLGLTGTGTAAATTTTAAAATTTAVTQTGVQISRHAAQRMAERGITDSMVQTAVRTGTRFFDPKNGSINYVIKNGFAIGKHLLVATNPFTGQVTTVIRGSNVVRSRFVPIP